MTVDPMNVSTAALIAVSIIAAVTADVTISSLIITNADAVGAGAGLYADLDADADAAEYAIYSGDADAGADGTAGGKLNIAGADIVRPCLFIFKNLIKRSGVI